MRSITARVCEVNKPLLSAKKVMAAGSRVVFDDEEGDYILHKKTGRITPMRKCAGTYKVDLWMNKPAATKRIMEVQKGTEESWATDAIPHQALHKTSFSDDLGKGYNLQRHDHGTHPVHPMFPNTGTHTIPSRIIRPSKDVA